LKLVSLFAIVLALAIGAGHGLAGDREPCDADGKCFLQRWHPVGGWDPYGGGLLRWWNPCCFPHCGGPDDYCRKPFPCVCWPCYPPSFIVVPAGNCVVAPHDAAPNAVPCKSIRDSFGY